MTLALGDKRELDIELHKPPSVFARWWFWTAIGVVVAGAAATVIAFQVEKKPDAEQLRRRRDRPRSLTAKTHRRGPRIVR